MSDLGRSVDRDAIHHELSELVMLLHGFDQRCDSKDVEGKLLRLSLSLFPEGPPTDNDSPFSIAYSNYTLELSVESLGVWADEDPDEISSATTIAKLMAFHPRPTMQQAAHRTLEQLQLPRFSRADLEGLCFNVFGVGNDGRLHQLGRMKLDERGIAALPNLDAKEPLLIAHVVPEASPEHVYHVPFDESPLNRLRPPSIIDSQAAGRPPSPDFSEPVLMSVEYRLSGLPSAKRVVLEETRSNRTKVIVNASRQMQDQRVQVKLGSASYDVLMDGGEQEEATGSFELERPLWDVISTIDEVSVSEKEPTATAASSTQTQQDTITPSKADLYALQAATGAGSSGQLMTGDFWEISVTHEANAVSLLIHVDNDKCTAGCIRLRLWSADRQDQTTRLVPMFERPGQPRREGGAEIQRSQFPPRFGGDDSRSYEIDMVDSESLTPDELIRLDEMIDEVVYEPSLHEQLTQLRDEAKQE